jgi:hypothetical protein
MHADELITDNRLGTRIHVDGHGFPTDDRLLTTDYRIPINIPPARNAYTNRGGDAGGVCALRVWLGTDNCPLGTAAASALPVCSVLCLPSSGPTMSRRPLACHVSLVAWNHFSVVFLLASPTNSRENTSASAYVDEASLTML